MDRANPLDRFLEKLEFDAYLIRDDSASNPDLYYLTGFEASDPFIYLRRDGESIILVPQLESSRAKEEAETDRVVSTSSYSEGETRDSDEKKISVLKQFLKEHEVENVAVPEDFSLKTARQLEDEGFGVEPVEKRVMEARKTKDQEELEKIREAQQATEQAMKYAEHMIRESEVNKGVLILEGEKLTSEKLRTEIKKYLIKRGCDLPHEIIASSGKESAKPHSTGSGEIREGKPIVVDIFPRKDRYFGDMTRTFVKGEMSEEVQEMEKAVKDALDAAFEVLEKGTGLKAKEIHNAVCEVFEENGYETLRNKDAETGFIHSTGHGVGLKLHETPRIANNSDQLKPGMILTIEPGLYLPEKGGLRLEDMILIKENGYENFNSMHKDIQID